MKKFEIIKKHSEFTNIIKNANFIKNQHFVIYFIDSNFNYSRFGIAISTKFGKANVRNYYKRIIRNMIDLNKNSFKNNTDYIIMIKRNCIEYKYNELLSSFNNLVKELNNEK